MSELDQAAVEAAAKAYWISSTGRNDTRGTMAWEEQSDALKSGVREAVSASVIGYQTAMAPQVREAVKAYGSACCGYGAHGTYTDSSRQAHRIDPLHSELLEMLGAQDETK